MCSLLIIHKSCILQKSSKQISVKLKTGVSHQRQRYRSYHLADVSMGKYTFIIQQMYTWESIPLSFSRCVHRNVSLYHLAVYPWESIPLSFSTCVHRKVYLYHLAGVSMGKYTFIIQQVCPQESIPLSFSRCVHRKVYLYHLAGVSMGKYPFIIQQVYPWESIPLSFSRCIDGKVSLYLQQVYPC